MLRFASATLTQREHKRPRIFSHARVLAAGGPPCHGIAPVKGVSPADIISANRALTSVDLAVDSDVTHAHNDSRSAKREFCGVGGRLEPSGFGAPNASASVDDAARILPPQDRS